MRRLAILLLALAAGPGCLLWSGDGSGGDDVCVLAENEAAIAPAPLRNPADLTCQSFGPGCDPDCGPCPATAVDLAPTASWGICGSVCDQLGPSACAGEPGCRTVKDANCSLGPQLCLTDFLGCFPTDTAADDTVACFAADAWTCSRSHACTAHHTQATACPAGVADCPRPFATCTPVGVEPGQCTGSVTCRRVAPACPTGTTPGISNGCYTGACIVSAACPGQA